MLKKFNITGTCYPALHYMADTSAKLKAIMAMVEAGEYFTINRPRQYGKTTMLATLAEALSARGDYLPLRMNFQGIDSKWHASDSAFAEMVLKQMADALEYQDKELFNALESRGAKADDMAGLAKNITYLVHQSSKKLVLLIDEVDASSNHLPFLSFLGMLRTKYLDRLSPQHATFQSVVLAGVHDIKTLKSKIRTAEDADKYNSPWNIAADFKVTMSLLPHEIVPMLEDFAQEQGVQLDAAGMAGRIYYYTSGYPFLVSKLCKTMAEDLLPAKAEKALGEAELAQAVQLLLRENNTNFDSLIKNLENNPGLYQLVYRLAIDNEQMLFNNHDPLISLGVLYGILRDSNGLSIHNPIYAELISNYMASKLVTTSTLVRGQTASPYLLPGNALNLALLLSNFQAYMKEEYSSKDWSFLERHGRLVFLAFVKPILNSKGHTFKEPQISEEQRLDVALTFLERKYIVEMKIWRGPQAHEEGLKQLSAYLDSQGLDEGYLVIFDPRTKEKSWAQQWIEMEGKRVFAIWV
jgi:hypothetical protein